MEITIVELVISFKVPVSVPHKASGADWRCTV